MTVPAETLQPLPWDADIASAAALIADSTRAAILRALLPDRPLAAGELARLAGVSAATASLDRKSTRLNSSHANISYAVFCLKKKKRSQPLVPPLRITQHTNS